ncbi:hypothetical protein SDC9_183677 [bioreactor metagenome]|uniref:Uncharacterized protein n=1 Tax=bioreactor metagenome TaxID=1076179 RepID=A0A645HBT2_9ZZZZ
MPRLPVRFDLADELVRLSVHQQPDVPVGFPVAGCVAGIDAFNVKDRNPFKQAAQRFMGAGFFGFQVFGGFQHLLKIARSVKFWEISFMEVVSAIVEIIIELEMPGCRRGIVRQGAALRQGLQGAGRRFHQEAFQMR